MNVKNVNLGFSYEPEEDDLISYESIILHWLEQLMTMETPEEFQELEEIN